jgi:hypothetical protein
MANAKIIKYSKKVLRIALWFLAIFITLFLIISILLQFASVQTYLITQITSRITGRIESTFTIEKVAIRFPKAIGLEGIYATDMHGDTLLYAGSIFVDVNMMALMRSRVVVNSLELTDVAAYMKRMEPDTVYNYQFLIDAFAGDQAERKDTSQENTDTIATTTNQNATGWSVKVKNVRLRNIRYQLTDYFSGIDLNVGIEAFDTSVGDSDFLAGIYHLGATKLTRPQIIIQMQAPAFLSEPDSIPNQIPELDLALKQLNVSDLQFKLTDDKGTLMSITSEEIDLEPENILLHENLIDITNLDIKKLISKFQFRQKEVDTIIDEILDEAIDKTEPQHFSFDFAEIMDWHISIGNLLISESFFSMQQGTPVKTNTFNPDDITIQKINLHAVGTKVGPEEITLELKKTSMDFAEQFGISDFRANIEIGSSTRIHVDNLQTTASQLAFTLTSPKSFLSINEEEMFDYPFDLVINTGHVQNDLAWLIPAMNDYYFNWPGAQGIQIGGRLHGKADNLISDDFWVEGPNFFRVNLTGQIQGLPAIDSLEADITQLLVLASPRSFFANLPDSLNPDGIELPAWIIMESSARGSLKEFELNTKLQSDLGKIELDARLSDSTASPNAFRARLHTASFDLGKLLKQQENISKPLAINFEAEGNGIDSETMDSRAIFELSNLTFNQHPYDSIKIDMQLRDSTFSAQSAYTDEKLSFSLDAAYGMFKENPTLSAHIELAYAQLKDLGFAKKDLLVKTDVHADLRFDTLDFFNGSVQISNLAVAMEGEVFELPRLTIHSTASPSSYQLRLQSQIAELDFRSNFSPALLPRELTNHLAFYYDPQQGDELPGNDNDHQFDLDVRILPDELITKVLLNDLQGYDTLILQSHYRSLDKQLTLMVHWPSLQYSDIWFSGIQSTIVSDENKLDFQLTIDQLSLNEFHLKEFSTIGQFDQQKLNFGVDVKNLHSLPLFGLNGELEFSDTLSTFHILPDSLLINANKWNIPPENLIVFGEKHLSISNFSLTYEDREISIASHANESGDPTIETIMKNIDLGVLTNISGDDTLFLGGIINGDAKIQNLFEAPKYLANLAITDFSFKGDTIGTITLAANNPESDIISLEASIKSRLTDLSLMGNVKTGEDQSIDLDVNIAQVDLAPFENFTLGNLTHLEGNLSGKIKVSGTTQQPQVHGELNINQTSFRVTAINAGYFLKSEKIIFDRSNLRMDNLVLEDSAGRKATIKGHINYSDLNQLAFNLDFSSRNFLLMNLSPGQNDLYSGLILMDSDLRLRGNPSKPTIEGRIKLNEGSDFAIKIPQTNPEAIGNEGVVEFIQTGDTLFYRLALEQQSGQPLNAAFELLDVSVNVDIDRQTDIKIIIDEYAGDFLEVQGGGVLSFGIDPGGRITLSGRYEMIDGEYLLTFYDVIRRNFRIQSGSNLVWTGDPLTANVDITAIYTIRTSAQDLMITHLTGAQSRDAALRQQYPFLVYLKMKGSLLEPVISFELDMPAEHRNAMDGSLMARINQVNQNESDLNKQVFALLILGQFIQDNPFASMGGGDFATTARSSASQLLTQQLNRLSDRYIKGIDVNFEVESFMDFTQGDGTGRTELQMEVSKNFFDERVKITVGGNIELEDETHRQTNATDIAGDFSIEYLLDPQGNARLKGFRTKNYTDIFDGHLYETGVAITISRSYNRFRDLFRKEEEAKITETEEN